MKLQKQSHISLVGDKSAEIICVLQITHGFSLGLWASCITLNKQINSAEGVNDNFLVAMVTLFLCLACILDTAYK